MSKFLAILLLFAPQNAFALSPEQAEKSRRIHLEAYQLVMRAEEEMPPCDAHQAMIHEMAKHKNIAQCPEAEDFFRLQERNTQIIEENCREVSTLMETSLRDPDLCSKKIDSLKQDLRKLKIATPSGIAEGEEDLAFAKLKFTDPDLLQNEKISAQPDCEISYSLALQFRTKHNILANQNLGRAEATVEDACEESSGQKAIDDYLDYLRYGERNK